MWIIEGHLWIKDRLKQDTFYHDNYGGPKIPNFADSSRINYKFCGLFIQ